MKKIFTLLTISVLTLSQVFSQWVQSSGPEGKGISNIVSQNGTILIKSAMKSTDNGDSWQTTPLTGISSDHAGGAVFFTPGDLLFAYVNKKLYKSVDNGASWTLSDEGLELNNEPFLYSDGTTLYATSEDKGLFKSTDGGSNWIKFRDNPLNADDKYEFPKVICTIGNNIIVGTQKGILVSENENDFTRKQKFDFGDKAVDIIIADAKVYVASFEGKLYFSDDNGVSWTENELGIDINDLALNASDEVLASTDEGIYKIENNGATFTQVLDNGFENLKVEQLAINNDMYFAATNMGICRSVNASDWGLASKGLGYANVWGFDNAESVYYMATSSGVWRSKSYGQRWIPVGLFGKEIKSVLAYDGKIYAVENKYNPSSLIVYVSADEGKSWAQVGSKIENATIPKLATAGGHLYCHAEQSSDDGVYKLTDFQGDWAKVEESSGGVAFEAIGDKIYNGLKVGDANGSNWSSLTGNISNVSPYCFTAGPDGTTIYAGAFIKVGGRPYAFKSTDGIDFSTFQGGMHSDILTVFGMVTRGDTVYALAQENKAGVYKTRSYYTTAGASGWTEFGGDLLPSLNTGDRSSLILTPLSMLLGSNEGLGVFRYDFEELPEVPDTVDQIEYPPVATNGAELQTKDKTILYPNPASSFVNIKSSGSIRSINIYNMQGQVVKQLEGLNSKALSLNLSELNKGLYLMQLQGQDGKINMHKIIKK